MMEAAANLAYIAYADDILDQPNPEDFRQVLAQVPPGLQNGPWTLTWGPSASGGVLLYAARGADGTMAVAFRGTNPANFEAGLRDFVLDLMFPLVHWPYGPRSGMQICIGIRSALSSAIEAKGPDGQTLLEFLTPVVCENSARLPILVTGHSFGGALAVAASAWLDQALSGIGSFVVLPQTFAAQTAWNDVFANWFGDHFTYSAAVNVNDVVPLMWAELHQMLNTYEPSPKMHESARDIWDLYDVLARSEEILRYHYQVIRPGYGHRFAAPFDPDGTWLGQAGDMHAMRTTYFPHVTQRAAPSLPHSKG